MFLILVRDAEKLAAQWRQRAASLGK